jgi:hypothetical protein
MLHPELVVHHGGIVAITGSGRRVAIRPGAFGDAMSLAQLNDAVATR